MTIFNGGTMRKLVGKLNSIPSHIRLLVLLAVIFTGSIILVSGKNETTDDLQSDLTSEKSIEQSSNRSNKYSTGKDGEYLVQAKNKRGLESSKGEELPVSELNRKYRRHKKREILQLFSADLPGYERDYLENILAQVKDQQIDKLLDRILHDGYLNLTTGGENNEGSVFQTAATKRLNSAIRVTGKRENKEAVGDIIDIASHQNVKESTLRACYEALGYLQTNQAKSYLRGQLNRQKNPFLKSIIIHSLTRAGSPLNTDLYVSLLRSYDPDLRNSAIVALGESGAEKAVDHFGKMFARTSYSSKILIVEALKKIGTVPAEELLEKLYDSYPDIAGDSADQQ